MDLKKMAILFLVASSSLSVMPLRAQETKTVTLIEDYDQKYMCSRVFELKHIRSVDLTPFVEGAIKRYNPASTVTRLSYKPTGRQFLVVNTGVDMMPYVVDMIAKLDRPCAKQDESKSIVDGDGMFYFTYCPKFRGTENMKNAISLTLNNGVAYFDQPTNLFYWKDSKSHGELFMNFIKAVDRPLPQVEICIKAYEINESDFTELGIDYINWKNGPGASLFGVGYDYTSINSSEGVSNLSNSLNLANVATNSIGGFMVAPQFDATFIRMLEQKGKAKVATSGSLVLVNDFNSDPGPNNYDAAKYKIKYAPNLQVIQKDDNQSMSVNAMAENYYFYIRKPIIGFDDKTSTSANIQFGWVLNIENQVERTNTGVPVVNKLFFSSWLTAAAGTQKVIGTYTKKHHIKQNDGIPYLCDIPGLKYLVGDNVESVTNSRVFITVEISDVKPDRALSEWAGRIVSETDIVSGTKR